ncbi:MAG: penicillin-binding protein [Solirubrobacteraceae bacterium]|nr:penicillin-binding protein [Solirubrobacteraceae bacterium]
MSEDDRRHTYEDAPVEGIPDGVPDPDAPAAGHADGPGGYDDLPLGPYWSPYPSLDAPGPPDPADAHAPPEPGPHPTADHWAYPPAPDPSDANGSSAIDGANGGGYADHQALGDPPDAGHDPASPPADPRPGLPDEYPPSGDGAPEHRLGHAHPLGADAPAPDHDLQVDTSGPGAPGDPAVPALDPGLRPAGNDRGPAGPASDSGQVAYLGGDGGRRRRPRLRKLRLLIVLVPLGLLALVSAIFGMIMAIASDLPALENRAEYKSARNSVLLDVNGTQIGVLTGQDNRILVKSSDIPFIMKRAIISVEDKRFYGNSGIDLKGIGRALVADVFKQRAAQGASTITQQFVKNALQAQRKRTVFEKAREAAIAYHLTRKWSKDKILTEYLNSIYFGNGAYGIESAARTYFGHDPSSSQFNCGTTGQPLCAHGLVRPEEAALLSGVVASPSAYDPVSHPQAALRRRNLVLKDMLSQGYLTSPEYDDAVGRALPAREFILPPQEKVIEPGVAYFTTWVKQQLIDRYHVPEAFDGGLVVKTTLDYDLQRKAEKAVDDYLADPSGPSAAMVVIDNATGEVRALVGGRDFNTHPFNLATQGQRQPGSAFKPFTLARALEDGISPYSVWASAKQSIVVPGTRGREHFVVNNDEGNYVGSRTLADATTWSDNSVFAQVGIQVKTPRIAKLAKAAGIRTPVSTNYAITLGGLHTGVTPLDMAHAYETIAHDGQRVYGSLGSPHGGPVGIHAVTHIPGQSRADVNRTRLVRVIPSGVDQTEQSILHTVVTTGTGRAADFGTWAAGKTGTTSNYADAWFVGFTRGDATHPGLTVAVWVGYPDRLRGMNTEFNGGPVLGGTFPALIWHDFMTAAAGVYTDRAAAKAAKTGQPVPTDTTTTPTDTTGASPTGGPTPTGPAAPQTNAGPATPNAGQTPGGNAPATGAPAPTQATPQPANPAPAPVTPTPGPPTPVTPAPSTPAGGDAGASGGAQGPAG